jgi:DNA-binding transcriptional regulator YhcF (GntR family)
LSQLCSTGSGSSSIAMPRSHSALRARIHDGRLEPGERLPALRDLAEGLGVNANTIRAVYQRLEQEGLLASLQGSGTFVTAGPRERSPAAAIAAAAAHEARETGVDPREVAAALYVTQGQSAREGRLEGEGSRGGSRAKVGSGKAATAEPAPRAANTTGQAERRRLLRDRIAALEQALAELEVRHPRLAQVARAGEPRRAAAPRLLDTGELEQVQTELLRRIAAIQTAIDDRAAAEAAGVGESEPMPVAMPAAKRKAVPAAKPKTRPRPITRPATSGT